MAGCSALKAGVIKGSNLVESMLTVKRRLVESTAIICPVSELI